MSKPSLRKAAGDGPKRGDFMFGAISAGPALPDTAFGRRSWRFANVGVT